MDNNNVIDIKKRNKIRFVKYVFTTVIAAFVSAMALHVFVYPANFVPLGVEAVVAMLYALFPSINAGYFNLLLNLPLIIFAIVKLHKKYVVFTVFFTVLSSLFLIFFEAASFPQYLEDERLLAAIFAGIMLGIRTGLMLRIGSSSGGVDIIAVIFQKKFPQVNIERIITAICLVLIGASYFVYKDFNCILLGIVQMFISEKATTFILKDTRKAVKVEIITKCPERVREDIVINLRHSATVTKGQGLYSGDDYYTVVSILNLYQMADLINIIKRYKDTFVFYTEVQGVFGNFRRYKDEAVK
ncbi:MAG: YitT family protein [Clostridia bacterium]|nr:YitT family protein [Clostridia bacterium]